MQLTYYNNKSDPRYINKNIERIVLAEHANPVNIVLLENTDIVHPTFKLKDHDIYMTANYCYVDTLRRYYYIDKITLSNGYAYIECTCDVLMSYFDQLKERAPLIRRSQEHYNTYQVDDKMHLLNYKAVKRVEFKNGFDANKQQFVLCVIGNTTDSGGES